MARSAAYAVRNSILRRVRHRKFHKCAQLA
jgi:hypothetical protein